MPRHSRPHRLRAPSSTRGTAARRGTSVLRTASRAPRRGDRRAILKLSEQYKGGLGGGGKRVADTVGAGSEHFGTDGRRPNGGWEEGARGLRTGGQLSLAEVWGASKGGLKPSQEKDVGRAGIHAEDDALARHTREQSGHDQGMLSS
jgi:hypothetical protein